MDFLRPRTFWTGTRRPSSSTWSTGLILSSVPAKVVFAPNALSYSEDDLVTWLLKGTSGNTPEDAEEGDAKDDAGGALEQDGATAAA
jgi:hypothetical protein